MKKKEGKKKNLFMISRTSIYISRIPTAEKYNQSTFPADQDETT